MACGTKTKTKNGPKVTKSKGTTKKSKVMVKKMTEPKPHN